MHKHSYFKHLICRFRQEDSFRIAFSLYDGETLTDISYCEFVEDILKTASYFYERQIFGKHVAIVAPNSYKWCVIFFALLSTGNVVVPLNYNLPLDILQMQYQMADVSLICFDHFDEIKKWSGVSSIHFDEIYSHSPISIEKLYMHDETEEILLVFTSGTTGKSKAVMLSVKNLYVSITDGFCGQEQSAANNTIEKDLLTSPLFHIGSIRLLLSQLNNGGIVAMGRGPQYMFLDMVKLNPTRILMVPAMVETLVKMMRRNPFKQIEDYVGCNFKGINVAGAQLKPTVARYLIEHGIRINMLFGMTESAGDGTWCVLDLDHINSIGKPGDNILAKIQHGEILLQGGSIMKEYYKDPEETNKVIIDGWLHTGDMGFCDENGYYYITGRKKNVIILSNGENVNPEEIEATLGYCDEIEECLVYSDGKGICADVFAKDPYTVAAYVKLYNESMPRYRQVYKVNYMDKPLPKTSSGKIKRKENL